MEVKKKKYNSGVWEAKSDSTEWSAWCVPALGADEGERRKKSHGKRQKEKSPERINFRLEPEDDQLFIWYAPHGHSGNTPERD